MAEFDCGLSKKGVGVCHCSALQCLVSADQHSLPQGWPLAWEADG